MQYFSYENGQKIKKNVGQSSLSLNMGSEKYQPCWTESPILTSIVLMINLSYFKCCSLTLSHPGFALSNVIYD